MLVLMVVGLVAGVITSLSPCVLPVLPVVLTASVPSHTGAASSGATERDDTGRRERSWRPYGVVAGLMLSFSVATLFGSLLLSALHLPANLLRVVGIAVLVVIGVSFILRPFGELLERPFTRLAGRPVNPKSNGLILGMGLGLLYVPCAGPVLTVISVVGASHQFSAEALVLTGAFAVGVGLPLLALALAGESLGRRLAVVRRNAPRLRTAGGAVMIALALLMAFNLTDALQRMIPAYASSLEQKAEAGASRQLHGLTPQSRAGLKVNPHGGPGCSEGNPALVECGKAPEPTGITGWFNTPGDAPLTLASLRGKVVLVDFWTYSCINCQRTLPHLAAWYRAYKDAGLVIIGMHTPEFAFEHTPSNVRQQAHALGVEYPVAIDNGFATWRKYNATWPSEFLIDASGTVRHVRLTEGGYSDTEGLIRQLLVDRNPQAALPPPTDVPDATPKQEDTPETYLGAHFEPLHISGPQPKPGVSTAYQFPTELRPNTFGLSGNWTASPQSLNAGPGAQLELSFHARKVHLVAGGQGNIRVSVDGRPDLSVAVNGPPTLYTLLEQPQNQRMTIRLTPDPGVQAYSFTFD
jgi:cytochrome c biogenesis protein CcdA/thiol-disulfide isomerase/thioredoxin